jgi:Putative esterase
VKKQKPGGRVVLERVESRVLRGNPLGDPSVRTVPVYLPAGYDDVENAKKRYPVIYVLTGFTGSGRALLNVSAFGEAFDARLDRLIGSGAMKPCIVVMPDCMTAYGGSQYVNSRATGRYEDHLAVELVRFVDGKYRTLAERRHRAVAGKSSGGYGALVHAMKHPDVFGAAASHSGDIGFEQCYLPDFGRAATEIGLAGGARAWMEKFRAARRKSHAHHTVLNVIGMATCYSPNPSQPLGCDLPFDLETCELRPSVWRKWLAHDPLQMIKAPAHARALRSLRLLFVDAGTRDEYYLHFGARRFVRQAKSLAVRVVHQEFDDGHMDVSYRYDVSLPLVAKAIS